MLLAAPGPTGSTLAHVRRIPTAVVLALLVGILIATPVSSALGTSTAYTVAASASCLRGLPGAVTGLPPALPPADRAVFVFTYPRDDLPPTLRGWLGVWSGSRQLGNYTGGTFSFFRSANAARAFARSNGGIVDRNVVVGWDQPSFSTGAWRNSVRACLRAGSGTPVAAPPAPDASLATFVGYWGGHTRGLDIAANGKGDERTSSGCCTREYRMTFQVLSVTGTVTHATARYRVTSVKRYDPAIPHVRIGQIGRLVLRNGIVTNSLVDVYFCSDPAWGATGACGA